MLDNETAQIETTELNTETQLPDSTENQQTEPTDLRSMLVEELNRLTGDKSEKQTNAETEQTVETDETKAETETETPQTDTRYSKAPDSWNKETKAVYDALPEEIKQQIHKREDDFHKGIEQYKQAHEYTQQTIAPVAQELMELRQFYGNEQEGIKDLVANFRVAMQNPVEFIQAFAQSRGLNIQIDGTQQPSINQQLNPVLQQLQQLKNYVTTQQREREMTEIQQAQRQIADFTSNPEYKHFEAVKQDMAALLQNGLASDLADAYEKAVWQKPDLRKELIAQQQQSFLADKAKTADKAKAKTIANQGKLPNQQSQRKTPQSVHDIAKETAKNLGLLN